MQKRTLSSRVRSGRNTFTRNRENGVGIVKSAIRRIKSALSDS